jgi:hypothetical protein
LTWLTGLLIFQTATFEIQRYLCDVIKTFHFPVFNKKRNYSAISEGKHKRISNVLADADSDNSRALVQIQTTTSVSTNVSRATAASTGADINLPEHPSICSQTNTSNRISSMFYGANLHVNSMNVYMCDRHWQYSCLIHMKWALKWIILLTSILEPNFDIYSLVTYILLLNIFSAKLLFIFKNLIRIPMVYLPVHLSLKSWVLRLIVLLRKISWGLMGVTKFLNNLNIGSNIH